MPDNDAAEGDRHPSSQKGVLVGVLLAMTATLAPLGTVVLAPALPLIQEVYVDSQLPIAMLLSAPALAIGLFGAFAGQVVDRIGRRILLLSALVGYAIVGTSPAWLPEELITGSIVLLFALRLLLGVFEVAVVTACTTLVFDYFVGERRSRYIALQNIFMGVSSVIFTAAGGALAIAGWRAPFWVYALAASLFIVLFFTITEPRVKHSDNVPSAAKLRIPWGLLLARLLLTTFFGIAYLAVVSQISFVYTAVGIPVTDTPTLGLLAALSALATAAGSLAFAWLARLGARILLSLALGMIALGLIGVWTAGAAGGFAGVLVGALVASLGSGLALPTAVAWTVTPVGFFLRGRAAGLFTAALGLGQFVSPLVVFALMGGQGYSALPQALGIVGVVAAALALIVATKVRRFERVDGIEGSAEEVALPVP